MPLYINRDSECPFKSGCCCREPELWRTVDDPVIRSAGPEQAVCPHLGTQGCTLPRDKMPVGCKRYLCDIAEAFVLGHLTEERAWVYVRLRDEKNALR